MEKFCKDCKHSREAADGNPYKLTCASPNNEVPSQNNAKYLVSGIVQPVVMAMRGGTCSALRQDRAPEVLALTCGPEAKWFEAKEIANG